MSHAGQLLDTLGVATPEEILSYCEQDRMRKEEIEQRQKQALEVVKAAIKGGKRGKKGKGGGATRRKR